MSEFEYQISIHHNEGFFILAVDHIDCLLPDELDLRPEVWCCFKKLQGTNAYREYQCKLMRAFILGW